MHFLILAGQKCSSVYIFSCAGPVFGAAKPGKTPWESLEKPPEKELGPKKCAPKFGEDPKGKAEVLRCFFASRVTPKTDSWGDSILLLADISSLLICFIRFETVSFSSPLPSIEHVFAPYESRVWNLSNFLYSIALVTYTCGSIEGPFEQTNWWRAEKNSTTAESQACWDDPDNMSRNPQHVFSQYL